MAKVTTERITKTPGACGGRTCIAGHRVRVMDIVIWREVMGRSADEIVSQFPTLTLGDVHAALAYYYDHTGEIQAEIQQERQQGEEFRRQYPSALQAKLERLWGDKSE